MTTQIHRFSAIAAGAAALLLLQGCSSYVSRGITDDGKATEVIFPNIDNDAWLKEGTFPNLDNLRAVAPASPRTSCTTCSGGRTSAKAWRARASGTTSSISASPAAA